MDTHLKGIGVENFRVFKDEQYFDFAPITILTGTNSSGKSSLINALKLLKDTYKDFEDRDYFILKEGDLKHLFKQHLSKDFIQKSFSKNENLFNNNSESNIISFVNKSYIRDEYLDDFEIKIKYNYEPKVATQFISSATILRSIQISIINIKDSLITQSLNNFLLKYKNTTLNDLINSTIIEINLSKHYSILSCKVEFNLFYLIFLNHRLYFLDIINKKKEFEKKLNSQDSKDVREDIRKYMSQKELKYEIISTEKSNQIEFKINAQKLEKFEDHEWELIIPHGESLFHAVQGKNKFSLLENWCDGDKMKLKHIRNKINTYYKCEDEGENEIKFHLDIFKFLSAIKWKSRIFDFQSGIQEIDDSFFIKGLTFEALYVQLINYAKGNIFPFVAEWKVEFLEIGWWKDNIVNFTYPDSDIDVDFLSQLYIPFLNNIFQDFQADQKVQDNAFIGNEPEIACYGIIYSIFSEISNPINNYQKIESVSIHRANEERFFKIKDEREFFIVRNFNTQNSFKTRIKKYLKDLDIADDIAIELDEEQMTFKIMLSISGKMVNLKDLGYGIVKLLPIMLSINPEVNENTTDLDAEYAKFKFRETIVLIEEPESNLHPALQSKLADLFVDLSEQFNIQFIIETHSEYLIRKLQYLTAKKEIKPSDTQLYYFHHPDRIPGGEDQIYPINIKADGSLTKDFGKGFFDEADNIALELFLLKAHQNN